MPDNSFMLSKAKRFMSVAESFVDNEEYRDIVAFNVHMALELSLNFVIDGLLKDYKVPIHSAYKREFPSQTTHNLAHVCCVLGNYVSFPTYISFAVMQMSGWCVNSRYSEEFSCNVEETNLLLAYRAVKRFINTLDLLSEVKDVDLQLADAKVKGKITHYRGKTFMACETAEGYNEFVRTLTINVSVVDQILKAPQEDVKFITSFMSSIEITNYKHVVAKLMHYATQTPEQLQAIREGLYDLHISDFDSLIKSMGGYTCRYGIDEDKFKSFLEG